MYIVLQNALKVLTSNQNSQSLLLMAEIPCSKLISIMISLEYLDEMEWTP